MAANPAAFLFAQTDWRAQLVKRYDAEARRLQAAYQRTLRRLELEHGQLAAAIAELERTGQLTAQAVRDLPATARLMQAISAELDGFARYLDGELGGLSEDALLLGSQAAEAMTLTAAGNATGIVQAAWRRPDPEMLARIVRYAESPAMREGLRRFGDAAAEGILDTLLTLTGQGKGSRTIATALRNAYAVPYSYAENMARTAQAYSYRGASHASYRANSDVVQGWVWLATLDSRTCVSCLSQHGTRHTNDETLNDHHRGRCTAAPIVIGSRLFDGMQTGPEWFDAQPEAVQRKAMGPGMYDAYRRGAFQWSDVSVTYADPVYGDMRRAATLRELTATP